MMQELSADPMAHALYFALLVSLVVHITRDIIQGSKIEGLEQLIKERDLFIRRMHAENFRLSQIAIREMSAPPVQPTVDPNVINLQDWKRTGLGARAVKAKKKA